MENQIEMSEGDCVTVLNGKDAGKDGEILMIDEAGIWVAVKGSNPEPYSQWDVTLIECREE